MTAPQPQDARTGEIAPEWRTWGPYLAERQWGTVREDYSATGDAWNAFPHDHARSRAYRWGEDGLLGISDDHQLLCFAVALWNGSDPILKERLFGLTGPQGNHGEDVKEYYYFLEATPDHAYLKALYKYPQRQYPYAELVAENGRRGRDQPEYELLDTGIFADDRYFDVVVEYAKATPTDVVIRISATNRGPETAPLDVLPTLWFRNTWSWGRDHERPSMRVEGATDPSSGAGRIVRSSHARIGDYWLACQGSPDLLFTENETNSERLWGTPNAGRFVKDGINDAVVHGETDRVNPKLEGTKVAARYDVAIEPGQTATVVLRLGSEEHLQPFDGVDDLFEARIAGADAFYRDLGGGRLSADEANVQRQALAGLIWSKQYYNYDVGQWLDGDPIGPRPPEQRRHGRNSQWRHHNSGDVISMPDTWEYPWYAAWDLAFHCIAFGLVDPRFAKDQLLLLEREWYMHPNGQLPAYEWAFGDVNPPVHIAAARALYLAEQRRTGQGDHDFLARIFHKLLLNFTWWVNRKDLAGRNIFQGGFLGLDNISVIDRSMELPPGISLEQADGTAWMATYSLNMAWAATELATRDSAYEDLGVKFLQHYFAIGGAMNGLAGDATSLWDDEDGFYYDFVALADGRRIPLKVRSLVGLLPIFPATVLDPAAGARLREMAPEFIRSMEWFEMRHPELAQLAPTRLSPDGGRFRLLTLVPEDRLRRILKRMFDPEEFLSDHGIRGISKSYDSQPYELRIGERVLTIGYEPGESRSALFGGNSNWRGPVWFPMNLLLIVGLRSLHRFYGDEFVIEYPTGSGQQLTLDRIADDLSQRLISIFLRGHDGRRPVFGSSEVMQSDANWRDNILFYEYFHGDSGAGIGASHQTGWTALVASLLDWSPDRLRPDLELTGREPELTRAGVPARDR